MVDIVAKLRDYSEGPNTWMLTEEAANEIERLRCELEDAKTWPTVFAARCVIESDIAKHCAALEDLHRTVRRYFRTEADRIEHEKARAAMREAMCAVNDAMENE